jgi:hypothetical protein
MQNESSIRRRAILSAAVIFLLLPSFLRAQVSTVTPRITARIDDTSRVQIPRSTHPLARPAFDNGRLEGGTPLKRMILILGGSPEQDYQLSVLLDSQQSKGSPDYHHWLTPDQFGERFGPAPQDIQTVTAWLLQQGFGIDRVSRSGKFVQFTGTSAQVEEAFQTQMHRYRVNGEAHIANATDISIPAALAPVVRGVASLNNFFPKPAGIRGPRVRRTADGKYEVITPDANLRNQQGTVFHALAPGDFAAIYDLNPLYNTLPTPLNGNGITIGIVGLSDINLQDIADFRTFFGLPANVPNVIVDGEDPGDVPDADAEATLDTEWSSAAAPGATIDLVVSADTSVSPAIELSPLFIVDQNLAQVLNASVSLCEVELGSSGNQFYATLWQQAAAQGISVFVSTGDTGAAGCDPNAPVPAPGAVNGIAVSGIASTPYNTAVGGSEFNETGTGDSVPPNPPTTDTTFWSATNSATLESALGYIPEMVWNESCTGCESGDDSLGSGGGGLSTIYTTVPSWQSLSIAGLTGAGFTSRALPDVSLSAAGGHDGYVVCFQASCEPIANPSFFVAGGTSFSSPSFAGIMAIVDQKLGAPQGLANYTLYSLAAAENFGSCNSNTRVNPAAGTGCVFNDVTVGNNGVPGNDVTGKPAAGDLGFPAGTGYDLATGLGSVDANNLVNAWASAGAGFQGSQTAITSPASINITHGQNVTLSVSVMKAGGGVGPTGNVGLLTNQTVAGIPGTSTVEGLVLSGGTASSGSIDFLPGGSYDIFASYAGDGKFAGSKSATIPVTVAKENSFITLFTFQPPLTGGEAPSTAISVPYGTLVGIEGLVSGASAGTQLTNSGDGFATGSLAFTSTLSGTTTNLGSPINLNAIGEALFQDCPANCFPVGTNTINASYASASDPSFNSGGTPANGPAITVTVTKAATATSVSPSSTILTRNGSVTLTATVETLSGGLAPTGPTSVQFLNNGVVIGTVPIVTTPPNPQYPYWPLVASAALLYIAYLASRPRKRRTYAYSAVALVALLAIAFVGCGGGGGGGGNGGGGGGNVQIGAVSQVSATNGTDTTPASLVVQTTLTTTFKSGTALSITANYPGDTNYSATAVGSRTPVTITVQ